MITLTDSAIQELKRLRSKYEKEGSQPILRLGVKPSGCSGLSYVMNFESRANPDDHTFDFGDIQVAVDPLSMTLISGTTVDFSEDLLGGRFPLQEPQCNS
jgi:iron-sulfur cluster assembly accessory protein